MDKMVGELAQVARLASAGSKRACEIAPANVNDEDQGKAAAGCRQ
jgi:hypothetical protein